MKSWLFTRGYWDKKNNGYSTCMLTINLWCHWLKDGSLWRKHFTVSLNNGAKMLGFMNNNKKYFLNLYYNVSCFLQNKIKIKEQILLIFVHQNCFHFLPLAKIIDGLRYCTQSAPCHLLLPKVPCLNTTWGMWISCQWPPCILVSSINDNWH